MGLRNTRRRRQAGIASRVPDDGDARSRTPSDDPDELVIRTTPGGGRYTYVSPNVRSILGYEPEELLAQPPLAGVHPDDLTRAKTTGDRVAAGTDRQTVLLRKRHADGHDVWLEARIATVRDPTRARSSRPRRRPATSRCTSRPSDLSSSASTPKRSSATCPASC